MNEKIFLALIPFYIGYIIFLGLFMFRTRLRAVRGREISLDYFKSYQQDVSEKLKVVQNHFSNQFEVPLLFFVTLLAAVVLHAATSTVFILGCLFILTRIFHSYIHLGRNNVRLRAVAYFGGIFLLIGMWVCILAS